MALANGAEKDAEVLCARLTSMELAKEVAVRKLEVMWMRVWDAMALLKERSKSIGELEASGDAGHKEVWALERRLRKEEALHCKSRRELEVGLHAGEEEARELDAGVEGLLEGDMDASRAKEVRGLRDQSAVEVAASQEGIDKQRASSGAKDIKLEEHMSEVEALRAELNEGAGQADVKSRDLSIEIARDLSLEIPRYL